MADIIYNEDRLDQSAKRIFENLDKNKMGKINFGEFTSAFLLFLGENNMTPKSPDAIDLAKQSLNLKADQLTYDEFKSALKQSTEYLKRSHNLLG